MAEPTRTAAIVAKPGFGIVPAEPGFGLYVHWPFCASKCPYCDFNSHVRTGGIEEQRFLGAYLREIAHFATIAPRTPVTSIFFGGGTPSLMQPRTVAAMLDTLAGHWRIEPDAEITLEANPSSVDASRFAGYRAAGVNRVSLGVQALNDRDLKALGRLHSVSEARAAIDVAKAHFERISFDLIYARPGQSLPAWRAELAQALAMSAGHLSLYQLTIEPDTAYAALHKAGKLVVPEGDAAHDLFELTQELTQAAGLPAYEISNHAAPGQESRHNLLYWRYGQYAGIGAGAHGRLVEDGVRTALSNERNPEAWLAGIETRGHAIVERAVLSLAEQADEMLLMGLRITGGVDLARLLSLTGQQPDARVIHDLQALGMVILSADARFLSATTEGRFVLNEIVRLLSESFKPATGSIAAE